MSFCIKLVDYLQSVFTGSLDSESISVSSKVGFFVRELAPVEFGFTFRFSGTTTFLTGTTFLCDPPPFKPIQYLW
jgi:hypothetical protein